MYIYKIKSELPITEYAPTWNISIGNTVWGDTEKIDTIRTWLLNNEEKIKEDFPVTNDAGTGLGVDSVSARYGMFNLFDFSNELPEFNDLLKFLRLSYINFVESDHTDKQNLVAVTWFNIIRGGAKIKEHVHSSTNLGYLSANMHLDTYATETVYNSPFDRFDNHSFANVKGGLAIFPSYVPHKTTEYTNLSIPRVSIACDLRLPNTVHPNNAIQEFMNKEIYEQLMSERQI
jgi:hypothetical protein